MKKRSFVGVSEAAALLGVSTATITRWANEEKLNVIHTFGGQRRIPISEIERLQQHMPEERAKAHIIHAPIKTVWVGLFP